MTEDNWTGLVAGVGIAVAGIFALLYSDRIKRWYYIRQERKKQERNQRGHA